MTTADVRNPIEQQIAQWRDYLRRRRAIDSRDVAELEDHLRDQMATLVQAGLDESEALLIAVKRIGSLDALSREFAREHSERLWKQLVIGAASGDGSAESARKETIVALLLAALAALAIKIPILFGLEFGQGDQSFYIRNASLFALPLLAGYLAWKRRMAPAQSARMALAFVVVAIFANVYPFVRDSHTQMLTALHLPIASWLLVGIAYAGGNWFTGDRRMDFVRFSGELFIYYVLIALGGGVLAAFTIVIFHSIGVDAQWLANRWLIPCGAMAAVIVGSWLVEAKQTVIENMAPVLTRLFTPLFAIVLLAFLVTMAWTGNVMDLGREVLIAFDLLLAVVVALVLYAASARERDALPDWFDWLQCLLIVAALAVDAVALSAIAVRISEFGSTPNRVAALGENLVLLVNLAGSAWWYARFLRHRSAFAALERWQVAYLPVFSAWAAIVVAVFPPMFNYH